MELCRLCNSQANLQFSENIFNEKLDPPIWKIVADLANLTILENDPYTKIVCFQCFDQLQKFFIFRKTIQYTDWKIRHNHLNNNNNNMQQLALEIRENFNDYHGYSNPIQVEDKTINENDRNGNEELGHGVDADVGGINGNNSTSEGNNKPEQSLQDVNWSSNDLHGDSPLNQMENNAYILVQEKIKIEVDPLMNDNEIDGFCNDDNEVIIGDQNETTTKTATIRKIDRIRRYQCDKCNKGFLHKSNLNSHLRIHSGDTPYRCDICNVGFVYRSTLNNHLKFHMDEKPYQCNICHKAFTLKAHLKRHLNLSGTKFCKVCFKLFPTRCGYREHEKQHATNVGISGNSSIVEGTNNVEQLLQSVNCNSNNSPGDLFPNQTANDDYIPIEEKMKIDVDPLKNEIDNLNKPNCNDDDETITMCSSSSFVTETMKHTEDTKIGKIEQYHCDKCNKTFPYKSSLYTHAKMHTGEQPYQCNTCGRRFSRKFCLVKHIRTHTGVKPYLCGDCGRKFNDQSDLIRHFKKQHITEKN